MTKNKFSDLIVITIQTLNDNFLLIKIIHLSAFNYITHKDCMKMWKLLINKVEVAQDFINQFCL